MTRILVVFFIILSMCGRGQAMKDGEIPSKPPDDRVAAKQAEVEETADWTNLAFTGEYPKTALPLTVRRQDHSVLRYRESCIGTPMKIGRTAFEHGLGTHAFSEIAVELPSGARTFRASVGIDNNYDTGGSRGSAAFMVEADGKVIARTDVKHGGEQPEPMIADIPYGAKELVLKVADGGDGVACDQADWGDARLTLDNRKAVYLDDNQPDTLLLPRELPFSFTYGGISSREFLKDWTRTVETAKRDDHDETVVRWDDPKTKLRVEVQVKSFTQYPATEWLVSFENVGTTDTPIIENVNTADLGLRSGYAALPLVLHRLSGDACGISSFQPVDEAIEAGKSFSMAPTGGRPSSISAFPFFDLQYVDSGAIVAVGWTGQWKATITRAPNGPARLTAGMELTHLTLHPGEKIRTPRMLVLTWHGDRTRAHNQFRRLMMFHYAPKENGNPARLPVALQTFDRYWLTKDWPTEAGQIEYAKVAHEWGCDSLWLDAAWFPVGFPNGVGNWEAKHDAFPNGLKPISDEAHKLGMKFILWFEPERVAEGTQIAKEHPEYVFGGEKGGLFKLNDPNARKWLTDLLSKRISEYGIDFYRNDFNIDPLGFWRANDEPDRQGITEIRYVEGLYAMWDELRATHPGLLIDNCASGGRRIDLEMCSRSFPLWRSDTGCSGGHFDWNQLQYMAVGQYVPLHTISGWGPDTYEARSAATGGAILEWGYREPGFSMEQGRKTVKEIKANQSFFYGDLYPLSPIGPSADQFAVWQLHREDLRSGIVLAFRRAECPYAGLFVGLNGIKRDGKYRVEFINDDKKSTSKTYSGRELIIGLPIKMPEKQSSLLIRYSLSGKK